MVTVSARVVRTKELLKWGHEAPGGVIGHEGVKKSTARKLEEEAGIEVDSKKIKIIFKEYLLPSSVSAFGWRGIIQINKGDIPSKKMHGIPRESEFTLLIIKSLSEIIKKRQNKKLIFDLWTSRLINEAAKKDLYNF